MVANILGYYLVEVGRITEEEYTALIRITSEERVKLGLIAIEEGLMTFSQTEEVNRRQAVVDKKFGEMAVELGYLTPLQVEQLLEKQNNEYIIFLQAIEDMELMPMEEATKVIEEYVADYELKPELIGALKSGNIDDIISAYIPDELEVFKEQIGIAVRTIIRCVDTNICLKKATLIQQLATKGGASFQTLDDVEHDGSITMGLAEETGGFLTAANLFAREDFGDLDEEALDSCAELLNCINGIYASMKSMEGIDLELLPPDMHMERVIRKSENVMCEIPILIRGEELKLILWN